MRKRKRWETQAQADSSPRRGREGRQEGGEWSEGLPFRPGLLGVSVDRTARWDHMGGLEFVLRMLVCKVVPRRSQEGTGQPRELSKLNNWLQSSRQRRA